MPIDRKLSGLTVKNTPSPQDYVVIVDAAETNANQKEKLTPISNFDNGNGAVSDKSIAVYTLAEFQALNPSLFSLVFYRGHPWMYNASRSRAGLGTQGDIFVTPNGSTTGTGVWEIALREARSFATTIAANTTFSFTNMFETYWHYHMFVTTTADGITVTLPKTHRIYNVGTRDFTVTAGSETRIVTPDEVVTSHNIAGTMRLTRG
jgi:hypothetical protein